MGTPLVGARQLTHMHACMHAGMHAIVQRSPPPFPPKPTPSRSSRRRTLNQFKASAGPKIWLHRLLVCCRILCGCGVWVKEAKADAVHGRGKRKKNDGESGGWGGSCWVAVSESHFQPTQRPPLTDNRQPQIDRSEVPGSQQIDRPRAYGKGHQTGREGGREWRVPSIRSRCLCGKGRKGSGARSAFKASKHMGQHKKIDAGGPALEY